MFERTGEGDWLETAKLFASDGQNYDGFGYAATLHGDTDQAELGLLLTNWGNICP